MRSRLEDADTLTDGEFECLFPINKQQLEDHFTYCEAVPERYGLRYISRQNLMIFM